MKVKVYLLYVDRKDNIGELVFDADLNASVLSTTGGYLDIATLTGMRVDCMHEELKGENNYD